jgi:predicted transcriptional regulator
MTRAAQPMPMPFSPKGRDAVAGRPGRILGIQGGKIRSLSSSRIAKQWQRHYVMMKREPKRSRKLDEQLERTKIAELTTEIVAAYVSSHKIRALEVPSVINAVGVELASLGTEAEPNALKKPEPAVPVRRSIRPDHLVCLACGKKQKLLKRHLAVEHEFTPSQYREAFGLKPDYPMAAPNYTQQRRELALSIGLGRPKKPVRRRRKSTAK